MVLHLLSLPSMKKPSTQLRTKPVWLVGPNKWDSAHHVHVVGVALRILGEHQREVEA
jgi:hypothetical protein